MQFRVARSLPVRAAALAELYHAADAQALIDVVAHRNADLPQARTAGGRIDRFGARQLRFDLGAQALPRPAVIAALRIAAECAALPAQVGFEAMQPAPVRDVAGRHAGVEPHTTVHFAVAGGDPLRQRGEILVAAGDPMRLCRRAVVLPAQALRDALARCLADAPAKPGHDLARAAGRVAQDRAVAPAARQQRIGAGRPQELDAQCGHVVARPVERTLADR